MVQVLVHWRALERLLVQVYLHVRCEVVLGDGGLWTEATLETLLAFVYFLVHLQNVTVGEGLAAHLAFCLGRSLVWSFCTCSLRSVFLLQVIGQSSHW